MRKKQSIIYRKLKYKALFNNVIILFSTFMWIIDQYFITILITKKLNYNTSKEVL